MSAAQDSRHRGIAEVDREAARQDTCVVFACDDAYGMPLAVALRSLAEARRALDVLPIYILADRIAPATRLKVEASLAGYALELHWLNIDLAAYAGFSTIYYTTKTTFARLGIAALLPTHIRRVLYLDADVLVLQDIEDLLRADCGEAAVAAVLDGMDELTGPGRLPGVPNVERYFNAGVLLIDLERWRTEQISERALAYLETRPNTPYADQDALNVACDGRWAQLDRKWNDQHSTREPIDELVSSNRPAIVHFVTADKPWNPGTRNPNADLYDSVRHATKFKRSLLKRRRDGVLTVWRRVRRYARQRLRPQLARDPALWKKSMEPGKVETR